MNDNDKPQRISIDEPERLLQNEEQRPIRILPDGSIVAEADGSVEPRKPLTQHHYLGGEY